MIIKEAMATNCPIVSVDVGDISDRTRGVENVRVCKPNESDLTRAIHLSLKDSPRTDGRTRIINDCLDVHSVAKRICNIYEQCAGL
jgi:glycosyltransferase involved in cell wall biosynthesis